MKPLRTSWPDGEQRHITYFIFQRLLKKTFRYYSNSLLDSIHRSLAVEEWYNIQLASTNPSGRHGTISLERALGAFDLFVLHDQPGDLDDVSVLHACPGYPLVNDEC
jgi:hypothetical protein